MTLTKHKNNKYGRSTYNPKLKDRPQRVRKRKVCGRKNSKYGKSTYTLKRKLNKSKSSKKNKKTRTTDSCSSQHVMRRDHSTPTYRHTNPMMNAYPDTKKISWYRFQKRNINQRGSDYLSRGKLGHHSEKEAPSTSIYKNDRISVKRQSSLSNSLASRRNVMNQGHNLYDLFLLKEIKIETNR